MYIGTWKILYESGVITMSERDLYLMYQPQIAEMIVSCQQMTPEGYEQWKRETRESIPNEAVDRSEEHTSELQSQR